MLKGTQETETPGLPAIHGDDEPFEPAPFLAHEHVALFGANYYASRLPDNGRWVLWDKRRDSKPDSHSDGEVIWINKPGCLRIHRQKWRGIVREGEENCSRSKKLHRNQKPVALIGYVIGLMGMGEDQLVCDPFMGSGSTGVAAIRMGHRFLGVEIDPEHFATAVRRIENEYA